MKCSECEKSAQSVYLRGGQVFCPRCWEDLQRRETRAESRRISLGVPQGASRGRSKKK